HPWSEADKRQSADDLAGGISFAESVVTSVRDEYLPLSQLEGPLRLFRQTSLQVLYLRNQLARLLGVGEDWEAVAAARHEAAGTDYRGWAERLFKDAVIDTLLIDEGGPTPRASIDQRMGGLAPARLRRVARTDNFVRDLLKEETGWEAFFRRYGEALNG